MLSNLRKREAFQVTGTCKSFRAAAQQLTKTDGFQPWLIVACSGSHKLVELDVASGSLLGSTPALNCRYSCISKHGYKRQLQHLGSARRCIPDWLTAIAFAPDHHLYACHYALFGVLGYTCKQGFGGKRKVVFSYEEQLPSPEGICFAKDCMYVASEGQPTTIEDIHDCGAQEVPWGITAGPDGNSLYVTCNMAYQCKKYYSDQPPRSAPGHVRCIPLKADGRFGPGRPFCETCPEAHLIRPSGLCFDVKGRLLVTSMSGQVHRYHASASETHTAGQFDKTMLTLPPNLGNPWDVKATKAFLFVSVHHGDKHGRVLILDAESGGLLRSIGGDGSLNQPNMLAVE
ncbi:hypothetical protein WJX73_008452 [Symbiochloris irregularis]|uniref:Uncharacterized protein n=1 Tax=Symbiochloris irregularis TaxID=706552 RepID=A0AAW1NWD2_9CHLO